MFTMVESAYEDCGYREKIEGLSAAGAWDLIEHTEPYRTFPFVEHHVNLRQWISVYQKA